MENHDVKDFSNLLCNVFNNIQVGNVDNSVNLINEWKKVLCRIKAANPNEGMNLAEHSRILDLKNGVLLVESDHPGWTNLLQLHKKYILTGLRMAFPQLDISTMAIKLKGAKGELAEVQRKTEDEIRMERERLLQEEDNANRIAGISDSENNLKHPKELPPELASIFQGMLSGK